MVHRLIVLPGILDPCRAEAGRSGRPRGGTATWKGTTPAAAGLGLEKSRFYSHVRILVYGSHEFYSTSSHFAAHDGAVCSEMINT